MKTQMAVVEGEEGRKNRRWELVAGPWDFRSGGREGEGRPWEEGGRAHRNRVREDTYPPEEAKVQLPGEEEACRSHRKVHQDHRRAGSREEAEGNRRALGATAEQEAGVTEPAEAKVNHQAQSQEGPCRSKGTYTHDRGVIRNGSRARSWGLLDGQVLDILGSESPSTTRDQLPASPGLIGK